ncbi:MAG: hypothetical protein HQ553_12485 [Chloroflexi bacterium]|nr:hypothetical protein [Chloroflexota bacterium]
MGSMGEKRGPNFASIQRDTLNSLAFKRDLAWYEMLAYLYFKKNYNGFNNGDIELRYSEMRYVMSYTYLKKAIDGLIEKGWVERIEPGGMYGTPAKYELTGKYEELRLGKRKK